MLGGSFNPAHDGHLHISRHAIIGLGLDAVWWMVSPQNPLKSEAGMAPLAARMAGAARIASADRRIKVTDIETHLGTRYTVDTIAALHRIFPENRFVWLMGADNLKQFAEWQGWRDLMESVPVAVFDRAPYSSEALAAKAARAYATKRLKRANARHLVEYDAPAWIYFNTPRHPASATDIRSREG